MRNMDYTVEYNILGPPTHRTSLVYVDIQLIKSGFTGVNMTYFQHFSFDMTIQYVFFRSDTHDTQASYICNILGFKYSLHSAIMQCKQHSVCNSQSRFYSHIVTATSLQTLHHTSLNESYSIQTEPDTIVTNHHEMSLKLHRQI